MEKEVCIVNLDLPADQRWLFLVDHKDEINELLQCYLDDFEGADFIFENIGEYKRSLISKEYLEEIEFIASISNFTSDQVLIANLYYDVLKFYFGCTAFAVESEEGILHARNLDWHTKNDLLSRCTKVFDFHRNGESVFRTIGWPGFIGALSGAKPGKFSLTLNAVLSNDSPEFAPPVSFLLRDILDSSTSFEEAKLRLEQTVIACDCLVLLSGVKSNEMVVIERTPTRSATRKAENGFIAVTNDFKQLENNLTGESMLQLTSCGRYERAQELINDKSPSSLTDCLKVLMDEKIMMGITVQQMVFNNRTGEMKVK